MQENLEKVNKTLKVTVNFIHNVDCKYQVTNIYIEENLGET